MVCLWSLQTFWSFLPQTLLGPLVNKLTYFLSKQKGFILEILWLFLEPPLSSEDNSRVLPFMKTGINSPCIIVRRKILFLFGGHVSFHVPQKTCYVKKRHNSDTCIISHFVNKSITESKTYMVNINKLLS